MHFHRSKQNKRNAYRVAASLQISHKQNHIRKYIVHFRCDLLSSPSVRGRTKVHMSRATPHMSTCIQLTLEIIVARIRLMCRNEKRQVDVPIWTIYEWRMMNRWRCFCFAVVSLVFNDEVSWTMTMNDKNTNDDNFGRKCSLPLFRVVIRVPLLFLCIFNSTKRRMMK